MLNLEFDHLGLLVKSIEKEASFYTALGYEIESEIFVDTEQLMRGQFLKSSNLPRLELIEDLSESKALAKILNNQCGKIYHMAFKVNNLTDNIDKILTTLNAKILSPIKEAKYYSKVCFIFLPNAQIIELVEYK